MKQILLSFILIFILFSCSKQPQQETYIEQALVPMPTNFEGIRDHTGIHLSWSYSYSSQISYFILYYSPGGEETDTISNFESEYNIYSVQADTNYIFHLKAVDTDENNSERAVLRMSIYQTKFGFQ